MTHNQAWTRLHRLATILEGLAAQPGEFFALDTAEFSKMVLSALEAMEIKAQVRFEPNKDWATEVCIILEPDA